MQIVLFDGVCHLCNGVVDFIIERDPEAHFKFAALQSDQAKALLVERGFIVPDRDPDSIILIDGDKVYDRSNAALRIARGLKMPWSWLSALRVFPLFLRDPVYRYIARNRYRWFGKRDACRMPTPELKARFL